MSTAQQIADINLRLNGLQTKLFSTQPSPLLYAAVGQVAVFGCLVTEGDSASDLVLRMEGLATGDEDHHNPDVADPPIRFFQYPSIASLKDGAFAALDADIELVSAPPAGLARYDIVYVFVGPAGAGIGVSTGTPSTTVKDDFDADGLIVTPYDAITDAALPVGAMPVARVYVDVDNAGVSNAHIADLRDFNGRLRGAPLTWDDLTPTQKSELIAPAAEAATAAVLADNEEFKRTQRTLYWLGA